MFGYIQPNIPELKVREKTRYESFYCGLCRRLGKNYGVTAKACVNYECTFAALMLSGCSENDASACELHRCPLNPLSRKRPMAEGESPALDFAAALSVILAVNKLRDNVHDGKPLYALLKPPVMHAYKKASKQYPDALKAIESGLCDLARIEKESKQSEDAAAEAFGSLLGNVFQSAPLDEKQKPVFYELGHGLGRYVYLLDAWDDRAGDEKKGLYNPFNLCRTSRERAEFLINISINNAVSAYNLLDMRKNRELADNIMFEGCFAEADRVFSKEDKR